LLPLQGLLHEVLDNALGAPAVAILLLLLIKVASSSVNEQQCWQFGSGRTAAAGRQVCQRVACNGFMSLQQPLQPTHQQGNTDVCVGLDWVGNVPVATCQNDSCTAEANTYVAFACCC
jgi:hypothetical protein